MSDVLIYHPGTQAQATVDEEALPHLRRSGWLLQSEHDENQAAAAEAQAKPSSKKSESEGKP